MTVVRIDKALTAAKPIFESLPIWGCRDGNDYLMGPATCVPLYQQLKSRISGSAGGKRHSTTVFAVTVLTKKRYAFRAWWACER